MSVYLANPIEVVWRVHGRTFLNADEELFRRYLSGMRHTRLPVTERQAENLI